MRGKPAEWTPEIRAVFEARVAGNLDPGEKITDANYYTPRPYVDEWNRGSRHEGFLFTVWPGPRVCFVEWVRPT